MVDAVDDLTGDSVKPTLVISVSNFMEAAYSYDIIATMHEIIYAQISCNPVAVLIVVNIYMVH